MRRVAKAIGGALEYKKLTRHNSIFGLLSLAGPFDLFGGLLVLVVIPFYTLPFFFQTRRVSDS